MKWKKLILAFVLFFVLLVSLWFILLFFMWGFRLPLPPDSPYNDIFYCDKDEDCTVRDFCCGSGCGNIYHPMNCLGVLLSCDVGETWERAYEKTRKGCRCVNNTCQSIFDVEEACDNFCEFAGYYDCDISNISHEYEIISLLDGCDILNCSDYRECDCLLQNWDDAKEMCEAMNSTYCEKIYECIFSEQGCLAVNDRYYYYCMCKNWSWDERCGQIRCDLEYSKPATCKNNTCIVMGFNESWITWRSE